MIYHIVIMSDINTISPNNTFSKSGRSILTTFIQILDDKNSGLAPHKLKFLGIMLMTIGIYNNDTGLVSWVLINNYAVENDIINSSHIAFANQMGFDIEQVPLVSSQTVSEYDSGEDAISSLYIDRARENYARFRNLDIKDVTESIVKKSSAGLEGWYEYKSGEYGTVCGESVRVVASEPLSDDDLEEVD
jgi:hypothetical protein